MTTQEVRTKYLEYFEARGHRRLPSVSLLPENDPTTLFTSSGMQPLVPYLLGQPHPRVLGEHVQQKGSNITAERLRFDFCHPDKLTTEQMEKVESLVNEQIDLNLPVTCQTMPFEQALQQGALAFFGERYPENVKVYSIGEFSREVCAGPHVEGTQMLGRFTLTRQESPGAGARRLYGCLKAGTSRKGC